MAAPTNSFKVGNLISNPAPLPDALVDTQSSAVIAAAGTTQITAAPITTSVVWISNNTATNGVILPVGVKNQKITIHPQLVTNAPKVYPPVGGTVVGLAVNANTTAAAQTKTFFICYDDTGLNWY